MIEAAVDAAAAAVAVDAATIEEGIPVAASHLLDGLGKAVLNEAGFDCNKSRDIPISMSTVKVAACDGRRPTPSTAALSR